MSTHLRDELDELDEKVGRGPALVLQKTREDCKIEGEGCLATNITLSSLWLANTASPHSHCCPIFVLLLSLCPTVSTL